MLVGIHKTQHQHFAQRFHLLILRHVSALAAGHLQGAGENVQHKDINDINTN